MLEVTIALVIPSQYQLTNLSSSIEIPSVQVFLIMVGIPCADSSNADPGPRSFSPYLYDIRTNTEEDIASLPNSSFTESIDSGFHRIPPDPRDGRWSVVTNVSPVPAEEPERYLSQGHTLGDIRRAFFPPGQLRAHSGRLKRQNSMKERHGERIKKRYRNTNASYLSKCISLIKHRRYDPAFAELVKSMVQARYVFPDTIQLSATAKHKSVSREQQWKPGRYVSNSTNYV